MRHLISILSITLFISFHLCSQSNIGFEFTVSSLRTSNNGSIESIGHPWPQIVIQEEDTKSASFSFGLFYKISNIHILKLNIGRHKNGRIFDWKQNDDISTYKEYKGFNIPNNYLQIRPSYVLRLSINKMRFPFEIGVNINKRIKQADLFLPVKKYNFDIALRIGAQYNFWDNITLGIQGVFIKNLSEYQDVNNVIGTFNPRQLGFEISIGYEFR